MSEGVNLQGSLEARGVGSWSWKAPPGTTLGFVLFPDLSLSLLYLSILLDLDANLSGAGSTDGALMIGFSTAEAGATAAGCVPAAVPAATISGNCWRKSASRASAGF